MAFLIRSLAVASFGAMNVGFSCDADAATWAEVPADVGSLRRRVAVSGFVQPQNVRAPFRISCADCRIEFERVLTIGGSNRGSELAVQAGLARDSRGNYYARGSDRTSLYMFDSTGKFLTRFLRQGEGPGEVSRSVTRVIIGPGDSLYVIDFASRLSVFSPSQNFVRRVQLPTSPQSTVILSDGRILVAGSVSTPGHVGLPFHLFDRTGSLIRSFGEEVHMRPGRPAASQSYLVLSDSGASFWHWKPHEYRFEEWSLDGRHLSTVELHSVPGWVAAGEDPLSKLSPDERRRIMTDTAAQRAAIPQLVAAAGSSIILVRATADRRLWVFRPPTPESMRLGQTQPVIDVIDASNGNVLASFPHPRTPHLLFGSGLIFTLDSFGTGVATFSVWQPKGSIAGRN